MTSALPVPDENWEGTIPDVFSTVPITHEHKRKWEETLSMMTYTAPGFNHLLFKLLNAQDNPAIASEYVPVFSTEVPIAATDGDNIILNPEPFFKVALPGQTYITAHEVVHNMFGDVEMLQGCVESNSVHMPDGRRLDFDMDCMQRAMDARINALLDESQIGRRPVLDGKEIGWFDKDVKGADSVYPIYERYLNTKNKRPPEGGKPGDKPGQGSGGNAPGTGNRHGNTPADGFDTLLKPGEASGKNPQEHKRDKERWQVETAVAKVIEDLRTQGTMPGGMQRLFKQLLEPEVSWIDHIETLVKRHLGDDSIDWTQPHPWWGAYDFFVPADTGTGAGWIVIWGDTSRSISDTTMAKNISELAGLMEQVRPKRLTLIWCDARLYDTKDKQSVVEITDPSDLLTVKPVGGGGTNYQPVLKWIADNNKGEEVDLFIGFTDGYVTFPKSHPFPTIWASSTDHEYPFGTVVKINNIRRGA